MKPKVGQIVFLKNSSIVLIYECYGEDGYGGLEFTKQKECFLFREEEISEIIDLPRNVKPIWFKLIERIEKKMEMLNEI